MGATNGCVMFKAESIKEAYDQAVESATYDRGHDPYNGTISTTEGFKEIPCPEGWEDWSRDERYKFVDELSEKCEKWGPAVGFTTPDGDHIFCFIAAM